MEKRNMKKVLLWLVPIFVIVIITVGTVSADTVRSPSKDTVCEATSGGFCANNFGIAPQSGNSPGNPLICTSSQIGLIGWDLSTTTETIGSAELILTTYNVVGAIVGTPVEIQLFAPSENSWTEDGSSPGSIGATLATTSVLLANVQTPQTIVFGGITNPTDASTLGAHFDSLKATGSATVGVRISGGCSPSTNVFINDRENTGNLPGGAELTEPDLNLFTPTAVSLSSLNASGQDSAANNTLFLAIGALVLTLAAVALLSALRKRNAALE
jgi:hypothetical protein